MLKTQNKIVAFDDNPKFLADLKEALNPEYWVHTVTNVTEAMKAISQYRPDVLLLDVNMPEISGIQFLNIIRKRIPDIPVVMLTAESNVDLVVEAIKAGAVDYVIKGTEDFVPGLKFRISKVFALNGIKRQNEVLSAKVREVSDRYEILGIDSSTLKLRAELPKYIGADSYVLILGENGTGKELVARNLNLQENDPSRPFVAVNCGAIPDNLFESELFGHMKGSFTGAVTDQIGKFVAARGGDLFLDEIGELPLDMQVKLLRVLQEKVVTPVGSNKPIYADVRVIAATNQNLEDLIRNGKFRQDLFYRLNQITLKTSPLRERREDISYLAQIFVNKSLPGVSISKEAIKALEAHSWPGNIRELQNTIERACLMVRGTPTKKIVPEHLKISEFQLVEKLNFPAGLFPQTVVDVTKETYKECMDWMQRAFFEKGLELLKGNNHALIERLGVSRTYYYDRKRELGLNGETKSEIETRWA